MAAKLKQLKDTIKALDKDPSKAVLQALLPLTVEGKLDITKSTWIAKQAGLPKDINAKLKLTMLELEGKKWFAVLISISETPTKK